MSALTGPERVARQTRRAGQATVVVGLVCTVVGAAAVGWPGLWSGLVGTVVVLAFFVAGLAPVLRAELFERGGAAGMAVVLGGYVVRLVLAIAAVTVVVQVTDLDRRTLGLTVMACALAWVLGTAVVALRGHVPLDVATYEPPTRP